MVYETYGKLNEEKSNAILVCHALSGSHHAAGYHKDSEEKGIALTQALHYIIPDEQTSMAHDCHVSLPIGRSSSSVQYANCMSMGIDESGGEHMHHGRQDSQCHIYGH